MFILSPTLSGYPHSRVHLGRTLFNLYTVTVDKILRGRSAVVLLYDVVFCLIYCSHIYLLKLDIFVCNDSIVYPDREVSVLNAVGVSGKNYPAIRVLFFQNAFYVSFTLFKFFFSFRCGFVLVYLYLKCNTFYYNCQGIFIRILKVIFLTIRTYIHITNCMYTRTYIHITH